MLAPFLDKGGIIRVDERLAKADVPYSQRHPVLLPGLHLVTTLIVRKMHEDLNHAGSQLLWCSLRTEFWILQGMQAPSHQPIGQLPNCRVTAEPDSTAVFIYVGLDFAELSTCMVLLGFQGLVHISIISPFLYAAKQRQSILKQSPAWQQTHLWRHCSVSLLAVVGPIALRNEFDTIVRSSPAQNFYTVNAIAFRHIPPGAPHIWEACRKAVSRCQVNQTPEVCLTFELEFTIGWSHACWIISILDAPHINQQQSKWSNPSHAGPLFDWKAFCRSASAPRLLIQHQDWKPQEVQTAVMSSILAAMAKGLCFYTSSM